MKIPVSEPLAALARIFSDAGVPVYAVGGLVRNTLLGLPPSDIDVASAMPPEDVITLCRAQGVRVIPKAVDMGTVEIHYQGISVEHTTFRREAYGADGAHRPREVRFGGTLETDASRRDFSVNALYARLPDGAVFDPTGGLPDLEERVLRTTSRDPDDILSADALRVLRLVRFAGELGFGIEPRTWEAACRNAGKLRDIAPERRRQEFSKILLCDARYPAMHARNPGAAGSADAKAGGLADDARLPWCAPSGESPVLTALRQLDALGAWAYLAPEVTDGRDVVQRPDMHRYPVMEHLFHTCAEAPAEEVFRLAGLLHDVGKPVCLRETGNFHAHDQMGEPIVRRILRDLRYPNAVTERVCAIVRHHMYDIQGTAKESTLRRRFAEWGEALTQDLIVMRETDIRGCGTDDGYVCTRWRTLLARMQAEGAPFSERELAVTGTDLLAAFPGVTGGEIGRIKRALFLHCAVRPRDNNKRRLLALAENLRKAAR